jgi:SAM-dependent methyltransferase
MEHLVPTTLQRGSRTDELQLQSTTPETRGHAAGERDPKRFCGWHRVESSGSRTLARMSASAALRAFVRESPIHRPALARVVARAAHDLERDSRVLDAGAGEAPYRELFSHCAYATQDWSESVHPEARRADYVADLAALPIEDARFDFVVCTEVLEHVAEPASALAEIARVLRPGGGLLVTVPFVMELHEEPHDHWRYTSHGLRRLIEEAGFAVESIEPLTGWFSTFAHVTRNSALAMRPIDRAPRPATRALSFVLLAASVPMAAIARRLDVLDERRAFPIGWACRATRRP